MRKEIENGIMKVLAAGVPVRRFEEKELIRALFVLLVLDIVALIVTAVIWFKRRKESPMLPGDEIECDSLDDLYGYQCELKESGIITEWHEEDIRNGEYILYVVEVENRDEEESDRISETGEKEEAEKAW